MEVMNIEFCGPELVELYLPLVDLDREPNEVHDMWQQHAQQHAIL